MDIGSAAAPGDDIWSTGFLSFESPLKDLLESEDYSLEQLLAEDELLQELRGMHPQLLLLFSTEQACMRLIQHVIREKDDESSLSLLPPLMASQVLVNDMMMMMTMKQENDDTKDHDTTTTKKQQSFLAPTEEAELPKSPSHSLEERVNLQNVRYPYMACEVICCEINSIIDILVDGHVVEMEEEKKETDKHADNEQDAKAESKSGESAPDDNNDISNTPPVTEEQAPSEPPTTNGESTTTPPTTTSTDPRPPRLLDLLFSVLYDTEPGQLDDYRAGYLDKILAVLCRKRPQAMSMYVNEIGGLKLLQAMRKHLYSHSVMQMVQRLLLPVHSMPQQTDEEEEEEEEDESATFRCRWSEWPESMDLMLQSLIIVEDDSSLQQEQHELRLDESQNASEVLITVIQNSPLTSRHLMTLTSHPVLDRIMTAASTLKAGEVWSAHDSSLTCAMNVLESLVLQLGGYGTVVVMTTPNEDQSLELVPDNEEEESTPDAEAQAPAKQQRRRSSVMAKPNTLVELLPDFLERLCGLLRHESTESWRSPMQFAKEEPQKLLGMSRLRIVRLLESLVLLGNPDVDRLLCASDCLSICLDLFWEFQWCSMLHQSVANLLVHVFEGANDRGDLQTYFLVKCNLLGRLMESFEEEEEEKEDQQGESSSDAVTKDKEARPAPSSESEPISNDSSSAVFGDMDDVIPVSDDDVDAALEQQTAALTVTDDEAENAEDQAEEGTTEPVSSPEVPPLADEQAAEEPADMKSSIPSFRMGYMGHVIIICQALVHASTRDPSESPDLDGPEGGTMSTIDLEMSGPIDMNGMHPKPERSGPDPNQHSASSLDFDQDDSDTYDEDEEAENADAQSENDLIIAQLIDSSPLKSAWEEFVTTTLSAETAIQSTPLGGYSGANPSGDPLHAHCPDINGLSDFDEREGGGEQGNGILVTGEVIDMDDNDLDMAATMMEALGGLSSQPGRVPSAPEQSHDYIFDDPLGSSRFDQEADEEEGVVAAETSEAESKTTDVSEKEEDEDDGRVPVMDLFAGNFSFGDKEGGGPSVDPANPADSNWSDFANFDDAFAAANSSGSESEGPAESSLFGQAEPESSSPETTDPETSTSEVDEIFGTTPSHHLLIAEEENDDVPEESEKEEDKPTTEEEDSTEKSEAVQTGPEDPLKPDDVISSEVTQNGPGAERDC